MKHFGVEKYKTSDEQQTQAQRNAAFDAYTKRAEKVGPMNAIEEEKLNTGPACEWNHCRVPYGVVVGNSSFPARVAVFISFHKEDGTIEAIDVSYDRDEWDDVLAMLNTKYGDDWRVEEVQDATTDYETKKAELVTVTVLTHRTLGINSKTGDKCSIRAVSRDKAFVHSTPPFNRAELEIKLVSKNF